MKKFIRHLFTGCVCISFLFMSQSSMGQNRIAPAKIHYKPYPVIENINIKSDLFTFAQTEKESDQIQTGKWIANTGTGFAFEFLVNDNASGITQLKIIFTDWKCGSATHNGSVTSISNWNINNNGFVINRKDYITNEEFTITGTFGIGGNQASGDWSYKSSSGNCDGNWTATPEKGVKVILVPDDFPTIEEGINAANSGDTVLVDAGTYHENNIHLKEGVVVRGAGIDLSIVDGDSLTVFWGADDAIIEGFTIINAIKTSERGIFCWSSSPVIQNNKITKCYNGISVADNAVIINNIIVNNSNSGIFCGSSDPDNNPQISRNLIVGNDNGISSVSSDLTAFNNTLDNNQVGIWIQKSPSDITPVKVIATNNTITKSSWYGIYLSSIENYEVNPLDMTITYNDIWNNTPNYNNTWEPDLNNISANPLYEGTDNTLVGFFKSGVTKITNEEERIAKNNYINSVYNNTDRQYINNEKSGFYVPAEKEWPQTFSEIEPSDYHLKPNSPCIDAGDPESPIDPDDTRADIGAFYFEHSANNSPFVANEISDVVLYIDSTDFIRDLDVSPAVFNDSDPNDTLDYSVVSSGISVANAIISGSLLTVMPVSEGNTTITVTADDGKGGTISTDFNVEVKILKEESVLPFGGCLVLDGSDDYAEAFDHDELDLGNHNEESLTLEAWVKFNEFSSADIISKSNAYRLYSETSTALGYRIRVLGFIVKSGDSNLITSSGKTVYGGGFWIEGWHHVAGVYNNTTGELSLYMDGELLSSWEPGKQQINNSSFPLKVGTSLDGCIDEMRISKSARYTGESYEVPVAPFFTDENTTALWHFDEPLESLECQDCCKENNCLFLYKGAFVTSIKLFDEKVLESFELFQNYPNPFSSSTTVEFNVLKTSHLQIRVYDILGREVKTLVDGKYLPGTYQIIWNGKNMEGLDSVSGIYLIKMQSGEFIRVKKVLLKRY